MQEVRAAIATRTRSKLRPSTPLSRQVQTDKLVLRVLQCERGGRQLSNITEVHSESEAVQPGDARLRTWRVLPSLSCVFVLARVSKPIYGLGSKARSRSFWRSTW